MVGDSADDSGDESHHHTFVNPSSTQLGHGDTVTRKQPERIMNGMEKETISWAACGTNHSFLITSNGDCYSFGYGYGNELMV